MEPHRKKKLKGRGVPSIFTVKQQAKFDTEEDPHVSRDANGLQSIKHLRQARRCKQVADNIKAIARCRQGDAGYDVHAKIADLTRRNELAIQAIVRGQEHMGDDEVQFVQRIANDGQAAVSPSYCVVFMRQATKYEEKHKHFKRCARVFQHRFAFVGISKVY